MKRVAEPVADRPGPRMRWSRWLLPEPRTAFLLGVGLAFVTGAYLTFGEGLKQVYATPSDLPVITDEDDAGIRTLVYGPVALFGVIVTTWYAAWHATYLLPATAMLNAVVWETFFWTEQKPPSPELTVGGMDQIGSRPTDVVIILAFVIPLTAIIALVRALVLLPFTAPAGGDPR